MLKAHKIDFELVIFLHLITQKSFAYINYWKEFIVNNRGNFNNILLVGTKCDVAENVRRVTSEQGQALAHANNWPFFETSSKENINVTEAFMAAARIGRKSIMTDAEMAAAKNQVDAVANAVYLSTFGQLGPSEGKFCPHQIALTKDGNIVVVNTGDEKKRGSLSIYRCHDGAFQRTIDIKEGACKLVRPVGVACDDSGNLIVSDSCNSSVHLICYQDGSVIRSIGSPEYWDSKKSFISDGSSRRSKGSRENGQFTIPGSVAVDGNGNFLVYDYLTTHSRIQVFRICDGTYLRSMNVHGSSGPHCGIAFDPLGNVVVADFFNHCLKVIRYSDDKLLRTIGTIGSGEGQFSLPCQVAFDNAGNIVVVEWGNSRIQILRYADGSHVRSIGYRRGSGNGQFLYPRGVVIDSENRIFVSDSGNHRIQVLKSAETCVKGLQDAEPAAVKILIIGDPSEHGG